MPSCPICGNDVISKGICDECQNDRKKATTRTINIKSSKVTLLILMLTVIIIFLGLFIFFQITRTLQVESLGIVMDKLQKNEDSIDNSTSQLLSSQANYVNEGFQYDITKISQYPPLTDKNQYINWMLANTTEDINFLSSRWDLSQRYIKTKELVGENVIYAFLRTPRENFVRQHNRSRAYDDTWLPIGWGATITDPDVVSMMTTALYVEPDHKVLEIGTGSGYQSAILSNLTNYVYTIEIIEPLAISTDSLYTGLEIEYPTYKNIKRKLADGFYGWEEYAPFDRIIITCAIDHVPPPLIKQLSLDGIIVAPIGPPGRQHIMQMRKIVNDENKVVLTRKDVYNGVSVRFIPFRDKTGKSYSN